MIDRRSLIVAAGALAATPRIAFAAAPLRLPLWPGTPPGGGGPSGAERIDDKGAVSNIAVPCIEVHTTERPTGAAMLIAGGGGYKRIEIEKEARAAARWLTSRGVTAFVLGYRLPIEGWAAGPLAPLQDAQRALRLVRAGGKRFGVDPRRVGVLGFSAGGHLMGLAAGRPGFASYAPVDAADAQPATASEAALIYPIITLEPPYDHSATRRSLVGDHPAPAASRAWSVETYVTPRYPRTFVVQAEDDPISDPHNSLIMAEACRRAGVPIELHRPASGGHGFGMGRPGTPTMEWPEWYAAWLRAG